MKDAFKADCLSTLIGSLPIDNHKEAVRLVLEYTPEIPLWVQLPVYKEEGMLEQFLPGMPGHAEKDGKTFINTADEDFDTDFIGFYEDYISINDGEKDFNNSRFALTPDTAKGFFEFIEQIKILSRKPVAVKGQITGPVTLGTGMKDQEGKAIFYDERIRDTAVKLIAMKARWQVKRLSQFGCPVIIFFDEPALAGFGSSEFISISYDEIDACFGEVIKAVHAEGGLAGIHVCANAEWPIVLESSADIVSLDAYSYFDRLLLYPEQIRKFFNNGGILAWGIVPTLNADDLEKETADSLVLQWEEKAGKIEELGIDSSTLYAQSLITPSCGTGSMTLKQAIRVLDLTKDVSNRIRSKIGG